ncbi:unnamed protein product [Adineta ricciae]|uniref:Uncharacterized protein n=1 Tax=Adineta ricciae TaxID=249248 RepID=A0A815X6Q2_ADIRI|nr:unnamed protein product [Adineta ricciae]
MKKRRQKQQPAKRRASTKLTRSSPRIVTKDFEIFVTDFLTDPCGLPVELKDCVLVDGTYPFNDVLDNCSLNNTQVLTNIFSNLLDNDNKKLEEM